MDRRIIYFGLGTVISVMFFVAAARITMYLLLMMIAGNIMVGLLYSFPGSYNFAYAFGMLVLGALIATILGVLSYAVLRLIDRSGSGSGVAKMLFHVAGWNIGSILFVLMFVFGILERTVFS